MIIGKNYQFIHLQKCGGTTIAFMLMKYFDGNRHRAIHNSENVNQQPIIGCIRNPFSWYVSLWSYGLEGKGQVYEELVKYHPELVSVFYTKTNDISAFQRWLNFLLIDKPIGLLTQRMRKLYYHNGKFCIDYLLYQEKLEHDFKQTMKHLGYPEDYVNSLEMSYKNQTQHLFCAQYYTLKDKNLVLLKDKEIFQKFY